MALEFLLMSQDLILFFCSGMRKTLSVCGGVGGHKIHIFTANILHFIQDIEDRCLLLTRSTSFVDPPFQEHWMTEKHHMDPNPRISSICTK
jgi:hypothetical protein